MAECACKTKKIGGSTNHGEPAAERYFHAAAESIQSKSQRPGSPRNGHAVLLETLFPEAPRHQSVDGSALSFTGDYRGQLAAYQIRQTAPMLKERLSMPLGFADPAVLVFDVCGGNTPYVQGILGNIAAQIANLLDDDGVEAFVDLAVNRFYSLCRDGLVKVDVSEAKLRNVYTEKVVWHRENRRLLGMQSPTRRPRPSQGSMKSGGRHVAIVLGCLPPADGYDAAVTASVARIGSKARLLSPEEYWRQYKDFLAARPASPVESGGEPLSPAQYRELLADRQALRDSRLRLLAPYTGLNRKTATEHDLLAAPHPLFFRLAEELIRQAGGGVVSLVSPSAYLSDSTAELMRKKLSEYFNAITITEMRGVDEAEGVVAGLAGMTVDFSVCGMVKAHGRAGAGGKNAVADVWYWENPYGAELNFAMLARTPPILDLPHEYKAVLPSARNSYAFRPLPVSKEYLSWPSTNGIYSFRINGAMEKRGGAFLDTDKRFLAKRMRAYFDRGLSWEQYTLLTSGVPKTRNLSNAGTLRATAQRKERYTEEKIRPYLLKPFDVRWCYHTATRPIWYEPRTELAELQRSGNHFLAVRSNQAVDNEGIPFFFTNLLGDSDMLRGHTYYIPAWFKDADGAHASNLTDSILNYLDVIGILRETTAERAALLAHRHVLAIGFAPAYLHENQIEIGQGWPRIPFPGFDSADSSTIAGAREAFLRSAELGRRVAALLKAAQHDDNGQAADSVANGFAVLTDEHAQCRQSWDTLPLVVNQEWGKTFRDGAVLPSHGKLSVRDYSTDERRMLEALAQSAGVHAGAAYALLGDSTRDIYLNGRTCLRNVPAKVWDFTVGGYQVLKKWLSYRETEILGRPLAAAEVEGFRTLIRSIARLCLLGFHLNRNYAVIRDLHRKECVSKAKT